MVFPLFNQRGELPEGEHHASLEEVEIRFGNINERRAFLMRTPSPMKEKYGVEFFPASVIELASGLKVA